MVAPRSLRLLCIVPILPLAAALLAPAAGVDYPGTPPGPARATCSNAEALLENDAMAMGWTYAGGRLKPKSLLHKQSSTSLPLANSECFLLILGQTPEPRTRKLGASELKLVASPSLKRLESKPDAVRLADRCGGWELSARLTSTDPDFEVLWRAILRDGANYIRQEIVIHPSREPVELVEAVLLELRELGIKVAGRVDGSPALSDRLFLGVEHPASQSSVTSDGIARCSYPYHSAVTAADPLALSSMVGVIPPGQQRRAFLYYMERERAHPYRPYLHHNNGEEIGETYWRLIATNNIADAAAFRARQEQTWRKLIEQVGQQLVTLRGAHLEAFAHDYEWDDENLVWQFHGGFPNGFKPLIEVAAKYQSNLGVWFSPWGGYPGKTARVKEGRQQGLESNQGGLSLAGPRYYARYRAACMNLLRQQNVKYFKFDGFAGSNSPPGAGEYRSDVEALWRLLGELREVEPEVFINPSSGTWPSPFWLLRADSIWRGGGDTGLSGAKGSARQQWISYRDFEVHNRVIANGPLYPISSLMIHGVMINSGGRVKTFEERDMLDEIRSFFATGVNLQELYISPELMTAAAWDALAECAKWSRSNSEVLADIHWIGGDPAKGEVYGWAAWSKRKGILSLRNPSDQPAAIVLDLGEAFELPVGAARTYSLRSPWSTDSGGAGEIPLQAGHPHSFPLKPFGVQTFEAKPDT